MKKNTLEYWITPSTGKYLDFGEFVRFHELLIFFVWRDIKVKYRHTVLGILWVVIQPLLLIFILDLFFSRLLNPREIGVPYPIYAFSGLICWNFFSSGVTNAGNSMIANSEIIKKVYFPRIFVPISSIISASLDFLISCVVFVFAMFFFDVDFQLYQFLFVVPISLLMSFFGTVGLGCYLSALTLKYRDFRYLVPFLLQILFFLTPIVYHSSIIENELINLMIHFNPMYLSMAILRWPMLHQMPTGFALIASIFSVIFFMAVGLFYFRRTESYFADIA